MSIIDIHTHAFPDKIARKAIAVLEEEGDISAYTDGTVRGLLASMNKADIRISVIASIATKPEQFLPIMNWSRTIAGSRVVPFPSFHPADPEAFNRIDEIANSGFKGVKLHPYYQDFIADDKELYPLYERIMKRGLILLMHAGYDMAFPRIPRATPERMYNVMQRFPDLKMVVTHLGGWEDWENAERFIIGRNIYIDVSMSLDNNSNPGVEDMIMAHPEDYILFGTDSPWEDQATVVIAIEKLNLPAERERKLFELNAGKLLGFF